MSSPSGPSRGTASFGRSTVLVSVFSLLGIAANFLNQLVLSYFFGVTSARDAFFVALTVPNYLVAIFIGSFGMTYLPRLVKLQTEGAFEPRRDLVRSSVTFVLGVSALVVGAALTFSETLVATTAPGLGVEELSLTRQMLPWVFLTLPLQLLINLLGSMLQVRNRFFFPAAAPVLGAVVSTASVVVLQGTLGPLALAVSYFLGSVVTLVMLLAATDNVLAMFRPRAFWRGTDFGIVVGLALPLVASGLINRCQGIVERFLASSMPQGSISVLGYGNQLVLIMATVISSGIAASFFPLVSQLFSQNDLEGLNRRLRQALRVIFYLVVPMIATVIILGEPLVGLVFERGAFDARATREISAVLNSLMGMLFFGTLGTILVKLIYLAMPKKSVTQGIVEIAVFIGLAATLGPVWGTAGIGFAYSASSGVAIVLVIGFLVKGRIVTLATLRGVGLDLLRIAVFGAVYCVALVLVKGLLARAPVLGQLTGALGVGGVILGTLYLVFEADPRNLVRRLIARLFPGGSPS